MMTYKILKALVESEGHIFFDEGSFNLNIVGIRSKNRVSGKFDDMIYVAYKANGSEQLLAMEATTDPGTKYLLAPLNSKGTAILVPGQYLGAYKIGVHGRSWKSGSYTALEQVGPMKYWRDKNLDKNLDKSVQIYEENGKTNIHRASESKILELIGGYSAGCQVIQNSKDFDKLMYLCERSSSIYGNSFTYTLIQG